MKNLINSFIFSLCCVLLFSGCKKEPDNCAEYKELNFDLRVHNNSSSSKQVSASNQELQDNGDFAECIPGEMVVDFEDESYNSFYTPSNQSKHVISKTWSKNSSTELVFRSSGESVKVLMVDGKSVELTISSDGTLSYGNVSGGGGSGTGSVVLYHTQGLIVPVGQSYSDCGGHKVILESSSGNPLAERYITKGIDTDDVYCGIDGAATFSNLPVGSYKATQWCGTIQMNKYWNFTIQEDECIKRR